jgi:hypothetical protein
MRIKEVRPGQRVRIKSTGKEFLVRGYAYAFNSLMSKRMIALIGANTLYKPSALELIDEPSEE